MSEAAPGTPPRWWLSLVFVYFLFGLGYIYRTSFLVEGARVWCLWDDGMISMSYASNWVSGHGLIWAPGEPAVQGYTNFGIVLMMVVLHLLPIAKANVSLLFQLVNLAALVGVAFLSRRLADRLFPFGSSGLAGLAGLSGQLASIAVLCSAPIAIWALQGSDTGLMGLWLIACLDRVIGEPAESGEQESDRRLWPTALLFSLGPVLRLDAMLYVAPLWLYLLLIRRDAKRCAAIFGATTLALSSVLLFSYLYYGDPLPNTFYLKATGYPIGMVVERGVESLVRAQALLPLILLGLLGLGLRFRDSRVSLCGGLVLLAIAYNTVIGGDWADVYVSRFLVPVLPMIFVLAAGAIALMLQRTATAPSNWRRGSALALFAVLCLWANPDRAWTDWTSISEAPMWRDANQRNAVLAGRFERILEPSDRIAVAWAGVLPYFRSGRALDVLGKSDAHIAHHEMDAGSHELQRYKPGHAKTDWAYVAAQRPEVVVDAKLALVTLPIFGETYKRYRDEQNPKLFFHLRRDIAERVDTTGYIDDATLKKRRQSLHHAKP